MTWRAWLVAFLKALFAALWERSEDKKEAEKKQQDVVDAANAFKKTTKAVLDERADTDVDAARKRLHDRKPRGKATK